jgi:hypothetical protein
VINAVGADMLSDSAGFARSNASLTDGVHERGLAMVNMSHERDNRRPWLEFFFLFNNWRWRRDNHLFHLVNPASFFPALLFQNKPVVLRDL